MPEGGCLCGAVRWRFEGPVNWSGYCHCESCRKNCAAPVTAFIGVPNGAWDWTGAAPSTYQSRTDVTRMFCATCGTPVAYVSTRYPDEIHFYSAALDDPNSIPPTRHFHHNETLGWLTLTDDLPKHRTPDSPEDPT